MFFTCMLHIGTFYKRRVHHKLYSPGFIITNTSKQLFETFAKPTLTNIDHQIIMLEKAKQPKM